MPFDLDSLTLYDLPYKNLVITGFLGVGKSAAGRAIADRLHAELFELDHEIERTQGNSTTAIKELYGESRLRALEHEACRTAALLRRAVVVVPGAVMMDARNFRLLTETGQVIVLYCGLGEALRRLHVSYEADYREKKKRELMLARVNRESAVIEDKRLLQLDTTDITVEEERDLLIRLWAIGEATDPRFRYGPPPLPKPPRKPIRGLAERKLVPTPPRTQEP